MGISGIENSGLSEESKKALQSETWQKAREKLTYEEQEESPENKPSIPEEDGEPEGNKGATGEAEEAEEAEHTDLAPAEISENASAVKERAIKKLEDELKNAKDKSFADPIIRYLMGRCEEDKGLSEDILQNHKTWEKCLGYVYSLARKQASGNCAAVRDEVVYEWAEDYYHKDDKAEEAEKAKKAEEAKKKAVKRVAKSKVDAGKPKSEKKAAQEKQKVPAPAEKTEEKKTRRNSKDLEGQMDMFSMMGM